MKNLNLLVLVVFYLLVNTHATKAQVLPTDTQEKGVFTNQKDLQEQLAKYGLKAIAFPEGDFCEKKGPPTYRDPEKNMPYFPHKDDSIEKYVLDSDNAEWSTPPGDINIFWIHGLNGNTNSLKVPALTTQFGADNSFPARKVNSISGVASSNNQSVQMYTEEYGITYASGDLNNYSKSVLDPNKRTNRDFIIAHSQGGIVAREWLRNMDQHPESYENFAHGLVTFGTPHWGAQVLNNARVELGNKVPSFMREACNSIAPALIETVIKDNFFTRLILTSNMKTKIADLSCGFITNSIIPLALDNYYKRTTRDFYVGSPFLTGYDAGANNHVQGLSEYALKVPVVQFYGEEKQPILWKFLSSTMGMGHDEMDSKTVIYGYGKDDQLELKVKELMETLSANRDRENDNIKRLEKKLARKILSQFAITTKKVNDAKDASAAYNAAYGWLANANDYYLTDLIGGRTAKNTITSCFIRDDLSCVDPTKNGLGSALPPVKISNTYTVGPDLSGTQCDVQPISITYKNYSFKGLDGSTWRGSCIGSQTAIPTWQVNATYIANDGVVLAESASKKILVDKSADPKITHYVGKLPETNHDQMKNCEETKKALLDLYGGEKYGKFFKVAKR
jgi:hypothetical protein